VGAAGYAVRGRSSQVFGRSFYHGDGSRPEVSLTFDDGPSESTPALLDLLAKHGVRASFFMCGQNVRRLPEIARSVHAAGHEIGNHSDSHPYLHFKTAGFIHAELAAAQESIEQTTGVKPRWFRAPFGVRWFGVGAAQQKLGLTGVMWNVLGGDWKWPGSRVTEQIMRGAGNGSIVCLHDGRRLRAAPDIGPTLESVAAVIPQLKDRGLKFVTVSEMLR
jgi:peptidoglycan/xylan/chitin deacetylase (PgdA/CDA1 family)